MQRSPNGWTIIDGEAGVLSLSYGFAAEGTANCFTARLDNGELLLISPPSKIAGAALDELGSYGKVGAIVANNGYHHLGIASWRARFPQARCFAAPGAIARIGKKSKDAGSLEPLSALQPLLAEGVGVVEAPSSKAGETWAWAKIADGYAWYASDILANMPKLPSSFVVRSLFKLSKSAPGYRVFNLAVKFIIKDKKAALGAMLADVKAHPPTVMVPAHGELLQTPTLAADTIGLLEAAIG